MSDLNIQSITNIPITSLNSKADPIRSECSEAYRYLVVDDKGITKLIYASQVIPLSAVNSKHLTCNIIDDINLISDSIINKGNGLLKLNSEARIPAEHLPVTAMEFKGFKLPEELEELEINSNDGDIYMMSKDGYHRGESYKQGDWAIYSNAEWHNVHNNITDQVTCAKSAKNAECLGNKLPEEYQSKISTSNKIGASCIYDLGTAAYCSSDSFLGANEVAAEAKGLSCSYICFGTNCIWIGE